MRRSKQLFPLLALAVAVLFAQSVGGRLLVQCADGSPCPLKKVETKPCCRHKPCGKPLLPTTCVVVKTQSVETTKPQPVAASPAPILALLPTPPAVADLLAPTPVLVVVTDSHDLSPPPRPALAVQGPRPPPMTAPALPRA